VANAINPVAPNAGLPSVRVPEPSLTSVRLVIPDHAKGLPVLRAFSLCTCVTTTPARRLAALLCSSLQSYQPSPVWLPGRPAHRSFRGLLGVPSRYGLHTRAVTVFCDMLHRRLQPCRYLHSCSGCFRLERLPGEACTYWKSAAFARRTPIAAVRKPRR
jgi:hypothetical protein